MTASRAAWGVSLAVPQRAVAMSYNVDGARSIAVCVCCGLCQVRVRSPNSIVPRAAAGRCRALLADASPRVVSWTGPGSSTEYGWGLSCSLSRFILNIFPTQTNDAPCLTR